VVVSIRLLSYLWSAVARLRESDFQALLAFLRQADDVVEGSEPFTVQVLDSLRQLVRCDWAGYNELDPGRREFLAHVESADAPAGDAEAGAFFWSPSFWRLYDCHPLCRHQAERGDGSAVKVSDFLTKTQLHGSELYGDFFTAWDVEDEIGIEISPGAPVTKCFVLSRNSSNFSERDRDVLDLIRPHLASFARRAGERRRAAAAMDALERTEMCGLILLGPRGDVQLATTHARQLLERHGHGPLASRLPDTIARWHSLQRTRLNGDRRLPPPAEPLTIAGADGRLLIHLVDEATLFVEELRSVVGADRLTPREREILELVAQGKSNADIAAALWVTPSTVRKHLEHIYEKLDVHSRTAALARVFPATRA
jgi:DNA-binding CsgD family transcriptional regulator